jgi:hypothetical protein
MATVIEATWTYGQAAELFKCRRETVSDLAIKHKLVRPSGRPLDERGMRTLARLLNVQVEFARAS